MTTSRIALFRISRIILLATLSMIIKEEFKDGINYISNENIDENSKDESSCCYDYDRGKTGSTPSFKNLNGV